MCTIPLPRWIVDAAARFSHRRGAVSQEAKQTDCSRQTVYDHSRKVLAAVALEHSGGPTRKQLVEQIETLHQEYAHLSNQLKEAILFPEAKQQEFSAKGRSMGISLDQIGVLLVVLLGREVAPARSTIERWVQAAGTAAGKILMRLDALCKDLVLFGCLDEIFFRGHPVLVCQRALKTGSSALSVTDTRSRSMTWPV